MTNSLGHVVVGGGISGMLAAFLLKRRYPNQPVRLVERDRQLGGLLRSFDYGEHGRFDFGVHTMYDTGMDELDQLLYSVEPEGGWNRLQGYGRDFGGAWFAGKLHTNTAYLDLRSLGAEQHSRLVAAFFNEAAWGSAPTADGFVDFFSARYGKTICQEVLCPLIGKFTGVSAEQSHRLAGRVVPFERLAMLEAGAMEALMEASEMRARIAHPDQKKLPAKWVPQRQAYYPTQYGMYRYIAALEQRLLDLGVDVIKTAKIDSLSDRSMSVTAGSQKVVLEFDELVWTTHPIGLASLLNIDISDLKGDPARTTVIASYWLNAEPNCSGLYYAFSYDPNMKTHRFSCPHYFCPVSTVVGKYRLISELVGGPEDSAMDWTAQATKELIQMGVFLRENIEFARAEIIPGGYPTLSTRNVQNIVELRNRIELTAPGSIRFLGMLAKNDLFFQTDIMAHVYKELVE